MAIYQQMLENLNRRVEQADIEKEDLEATVQQQKQQLKQLQQQQQQRGGKGSGGSGLLGRGSSGDLGASAGGRRKWFGAGDSLAADRPISALEEEEDEPLLADGMRQIAGSMQDLKRQQVSCVGGWEGVNSQLLTLLVMPCLRRVAVCVKRECRLIIWLKLSVDTSTCCVFVIAATTPQLEECMLKNAWPLHGCHLYPRASSLLTSRSLGPAGGLLCPVDVPNHLFLQMVQASMSKENSFLMEALVGAKVELAETQGHMDQYKRALIRAVERQSALEMQLTELAAEAPAATGNYGEAAPAAAAGGGKGSSISGAFTRRRLMRAKRGSRPAQPENGAAATPAVAAGADMPAEAAPMAAGSSNSSSSEENSFQSLPRSSPSASLTFGGAAADQEEGGGGSAAAHRGSDANGAAPAGNNGSNKAVDPDTGDSGTNSEAGDEPNSGQQASSSLKPLPPRPMVRWSERWAAEDHSDPPNGLSNADSTFEVGTEDCVAHPGVNTQQEAPAAVVGTASSMAQQGAAPSEGTDQHSSVGSEGPSGDGAPALPSEDGSSSPAAQPGAQARDKARAASATDDA